jgi:hypothetical protein
MPCYRCGTRQVDPEHGKSPWKRGVIDEHQVLVCPACQPTADVDLDRCVRCGNVHLIRRLDQVECLDCRLVRDAESEAASGPAPLSAAARPSGSAPSAGVAPVPGGASASSGAREGGGPARDPALAAEVARALEKVLGRR